MREFRVLRSDRLRNKFAITWKRHPELNLGAINVNLKTFL